MSSHSQLTENLHFKEKMKFHEGILDPKTFSQNYILKCYEPSESMAPFAEHYFISRRRPEFDPDYIGHDVLSRAVVSLFIRPDGAFIQGPTIHRRTLRSMDSPIYVGAQFKPGGFYPFFQHRISDLVEQIIPASNVFPKNAPIFQPALFLCNGDYILQCIDASLKERQPQYDSNIELVNNIATYIEMNSHEATVASVAKNFDISERSLQQLFQTYIGVGAKWATMRARFLAVTKRARTLEKPDWTVIAADFGYSDQSHFIKDFKRIVGVSPTQYLKLLSR